MVDTFAGVENDLHPPGVDISGESVADPEILRSGETSVEPKEDKEGRRVEKIRVISPNIHA